MRIKLLQQHNILNYTSSLMQQTEKKQRRKLKLFQSL